MATIRLLVAPVRSGSSALSHALTHCPNTVEFYQPVKSGLREVGHEDYSVFEVAELERRAALEGHHHVERFVIKETVGIWTPAECHLRVFPTAEAIERTCPLFVFRDPAQTWNSLKAMHENHLDELAPVDYMIDAYRQAYRLFLQAAEVSPGTSCMTLERIAADPAYHLRQVCDRWQFPYSPEVVEWGTRWGHRSCFTHQARHNITHRPLFRRSIEKVGASTRFHYEPARHLVATPEEVARMRGELTSVYQDVEDRSQAYYPSR